MTWARTNTIKRRTRVLALKWDQMGLTNETIDDIFNVSKMNRTALAKGGWHGDEKLRERPIVFGIGRDWSFWSRNLMRDNINATIHSITKGTWWQLVKIECSRYDHFKTNQSGRRNTQAGHFVFAASAKHEAVEWVQESFGMSQACSIDAFDEASSFLMNPRP